MLGVAKILSSAIVGRGYPRYTLYTGAITVPITLALYFGLIPPFHAWGAAIASSVSYALTAPRSCSSTFGAQPPSGSAKRSCRGPRTSPITSTLVRLGTRPRWHPMKPLTILVLPGWYPTSREPLAGPFVRDHARAAAAYGHNVVVLVDEGPRRGLRGLFELPESRDGQLRIVRFDHRPHTGRVAYLPAVLALARKLAREGTPVDVIHAHIHWMGWPAVMAGAILRRPVIISENSTEWPVRRSRRGALLRGTICVSTRSPGLSGNRGVFSRRSRATASTLASASSRTQSTRPSFHPPAVPDVRRPRLDERRAPRPATRGSTSYSARSSF